MTTSTAIPTDSKHGVFEQTVKFSRVTKGSLKMAFAALGIFFPGINDLNRTFPQTEKDEFVTRFVPMKKIADDDVSNSIFGFASAIREYTDWKKGPLFIFDKGRNHFLLVEQQGNGYKMSRRSGDVPSNARAAIVDAAYLV